MLYTSQAPVLDLTREHIKTKEDIEAAFHTLNLCSQKEEEQKSDGRKERRASQSVKVSLLTDSDSSDDNKVNPRFKTSVEERQYNTIPGLAIATRMALSYSRAQANPTVERGPPHQKVKVNKPSAEKTKAKAIDAQHRDK